MKTVPRNAGLPSAKGGRPGCVKLYTGMNFSIAQKAKPKAVKRTHRQQRVSNNGQTATN